MTRLYLAGPDVFLPDAAAVGRRKVALAGRYGFEGLFPLDNEIDLDGMAEGERGFAIYRGNAEMMRSCDAILANLTPFRGPSADVGTAFELGFFAALGKPASGYSSDPRDFPERTRGALGLPDEATADADGHAIERFGLSDNLMLPGAIAASGGVWASKPGDGLAAFAAFEMCLALLAERRDARPAAA